VYRVVFVGRPTAAAQLATALLVFVIGAVALERASRGTTRSYGGARGKQASRYAPVRLSGLRAAAATTLCVVPLLVGFVLPVLLLLRLLSGEADVALTSRFFGWGFNSLRVAVLAAVLAVVVATVVAYAIRLAPGAITRAGGRVLILGYAVPGTVLAVGVLLPLGALDNWLATTIRTHRTQSRASHRRFSRSSTRGSHFAVAWNGIEPALRITPRWTPRRAPRCRRLAHVAARPCRYCAKRWPRCCSCSWT
jgi:iron(III) transport system permease protein